MTQNSKFYVHLYGNYVSLPQFIIKNTRGVHHGACSLI